MITNKNFESHYHDFALIYGTWLDSEMIVEFIDDFSLALTEEEDRQLSIWMTITIKPMVVNRTPPIVTVEELNRPR